MILPVPCESGKIYHIKDYGAEGGGVRKETVFIQKAIDDCYDAGGGIVLVPKGTFHTGPLRLRSNVRLHLNKGAVLLGSADLADYHDWQSEKLNLQFAPYNARYLLIAEDEENIAITGEGVIDGQGFAHYDAPVTENTWWETRDKTTRPGRMLMMALCRNVRIETVTLRDAPAWTIWMIGCEHVAIQGITIETLWWAYNTDGIDIDCCRNVLISGCNIRTGDDAIVLRAIDRILKEPRPCEQVTIENCTLASNCNAIRISYISDGVIRNIAMRNLVITDSRRGITCQIPVPDEVPKRTSKIPLPPSDGPIVDNLIFTNVQISATQPLWFYLSDKAIVQRVGNIVFENVLFNGMNPSVIKGNDLVAVENLTFRNVRWNLAKGNAMLTRTQYLEEKAISLSVSNCQHLALQNLTFENEVPTGKEGLPLIHLEAVDGECFSGLRSMIPGHSPFSTLQPKPLGVECLQA